jgi:predicted esterase
VTNSRFRQSEWFDEARAAHRGEPVPNELRRRSLARFDAGHSGAGDRTSKDGVGLAFGAGGRSASFFAAAAFGAGLVWILARATASPEVGEPPRSAATAANAPALTSAAGAPGQAGEAPRLGARPCPPDDIRRGGRQRPEVPQIDLTVMGLALHTFETMSPSCGPLVRRYVELVPRAVQKRSRAPLMIVLHDSGQSAETLRVEQTRWYFDALAREHGFVLVYANATPSSESALGVQNSGDWQTDAAAPSEVDDDAYLRGIVADLSGRAVIEGGNEIWLVGFGSGATLALSAAGRHPDLYSGVAAFAPHDLSTVLPTDIAQRRLGRVLFVVRGKPVEIWGGTRLQGTAERWALALAWDGPLSQETPAVRFTGKDPLGWFDLRTAPAEDPNVRVLVLDSATDPFPLPGAADSISLAAARRRPGFVNGAEQVYAFLNG